MRHLRIPVEEYTTPAPVTALPDASVTEIVALMHRNGIRHVPIVDGDKVVGMISDRDTKMVERLPGVEDLKAKDVMAADPYLVAPGAPLEDVVLAMGRRHIGSAIVTEGGRISGIFTSTDALNALVEIVRGDVP